MMKNELIRFFVQLGTRTYSRWYRVASLLGTIALIFFFFPWLFIYTGRLIEPYVQLDLPVVLTHSIAIISLLGGLILLIWTLILQYWYAGGSGSHMVPTQRLIVIGPYKICRHPMQIGAILFYLGLITLLSSFTIGLYSALITAVLGMTLDVFIEEPALVIRFGKAYEQYQKTVPLIPFLFFGSNDRDWKQKSRD